MRSLRRPLDLFLHWYGLEVALKFHFRQSFAPSNEVFTSLSYPREIIIVSMKKLQHSMPGSKIHSLRWEAGPGLIWWEKFFIFYPKVCLLHWKFPLLHLNGWCPPITFQSLNFLCKPQQIPNLNRWCPLFTFQSLNYLCKPPQIPNLNGWCLPQTPNQS